MSRDPLSCIVEEEDPRERRIQYKEYCTTRNLLESQSRSSVFSKAMMQEYSATQSLVTCPLHNPLP